MIHEEKCYCATCDNCGEIYTDEHSGFSLYVDENSCHEAMDNDSWYTGYDVSEHKGKHYCPECFKYDENEDDKIIIDESRKKLNEVMQTNGASQRNDAQRAER